jgi:tRNA pseudouridine55 synthase
LGIETDSYDTDGKILKELDFSHVDQVKFDTALNKFRGEILQVPPK